MSTLRLTTAGESHGPAEVCILEGMPSGLALTRADVDVELARRQQGYGRGSRMSIETDRCRLVAGVRRGRTLGTPICAIVENRDHANWLALMSPDPPTDEELAEHVRVTIPRPGHADLAGLAKYGHEDVRDVLERASARETVGRVAGGAMCKRLLRELGVTVRGRVIRIGSVGLSTETDLACPDSVDWNAVDDSPVGCDDRTVSTDMCAAIDRARANGDTLGGVFEIWAWGLCPGLGGYASPGDRLDGRFLGALGSIPAIKAVEIGEGYANAARPGSAIHDPIVVRGETDAAWVGRETNRAGGIEGGMTTGMPVVLRAAIKPISTLTAPLPSVDIQNRQVALAHVERSDVAAVPAARVVGEAAVALVLAQSYLEKFGGDSLEQLRAAVLAYEKELEERGLWHRS